MMRWLRTIIRADTQHDHGESDNMLSEDIRHLRSIDPETNVQWLRLQRELASQQYSARQVRARLIPRLAFSATILTAVLLGAYLYLLPRESVFETYTTGRGEQKRILLHDSSHVALNYGSELVVQQLLPGKPRLLALKGEADFAVERNETPFIISTSLAKVQVVGTRFNVRERDGTLEVAVRRGIVNVIVAREGKDSILTLTKNQRALCSTNGFPARVADMPSPEYPGWMNGQLFLSKTAFAAACREIEMRFDVAIRVDDNALRQELVTGTLDAKTPHVALRSLCGVTGRKFRYDENVYIIY